MPRKPLDVRKAHGRLSAYGKQKAPWGRLVLALCLNTVRRRGSRQAERGINSRDSLSLQINFHFEFVLCVVCPVNSVSVTLVPFHYNSFRSFANSKTLAIIVSKKTRLSSSDNAVMSGVPTVTTSSSVFSTLITSLYLIFERQKNTPSIFRLENGKTQGSKGKILQKFCLETYFSVSTLEIIHCFSL